MNSSNQFLDILDKLIKCREYLKILRKSLAQEEASPPEQIFENHYTAFVEEIESELLNIYEVIEVLDSE